MTIRADLMSDISQAIAQIRDFLSARTGAFCADCLARTLSLNRAIALAALMPSNDRPYVLGLADCAGCGAHGYAAARVTPRA